MADPTDKDLRDEARDLKIEGRSNMDREQLLAAIATAKANGAATDAQDSVAGLNANADAGDDVEPGTPEQIGRPPLAEVAEQRAANRKPTRVIGADDQEA